MAREFGEDFIRQTDPFTGEALPGSPRTAFPNTTRPYGSGFCSVVEVGPGESDSSGRVQSMFDQALGGNRPDGNASKAAPTIVYPNPNGLPYGSTPKVR